LGSLNKRSAKKYTLISPFVDWSANMRRKSNEAALHSSTVIRDGVHGTGQ
jgi:hypothetical protein